jgi:nucleoside-diphosphate-sugar epimerase
MITHQQDPTCLPERVVVLGARGFIGAAVVRHLETMGTHVISPTSDELDLADAVAVENLSARLQASDAVVMLSALTPDRGRDIGTLMNNLSMMQNLCAAIERTGCAHLVYFSSDAVYDSAVSRVTEDTPTSPQDLYGVMHLARELMARSLAEVPLLVVRPTLVYGLQDTHNSYGPNRFRRAAEKDGKISLFGGGEETRDHIHVDDVARLTLRCLLHRTTGTLNVATGVSHSFRDVAEIVATQFDRKIEIVPSTRANPVTHRHYAVDDLIKAFPDFRSATLDEGIANVHEQMMKTS